MYQNCLHPNLRLFLQVLHATESLPYSTVLPAASPTPFGHCRILSAAFNRNLVLHFLLYGGQLSTQLRFHVYLETIMFLTWLKLQFFALLYGISHAFSCLGSTHMGIPWADIFIVE